MNLNTLAQQIFSANKEKGFWPAEGRNVGECIALMHSELSEALEAHRKQAQDAHLPHRSGLEVELADTIIRVLDFCGAHGIDIAGAVDEKLAFNTSRPHKHGKKY